MDYSKGELKLIPFFYFKKKRHLQCEAKKTVACLALPPKPVKESNQYHSSNAHSLVFQIQFTARAYSLKSSPMSPKSNNFLTLHKSTLIFCPFVADPSYVTTCSLICEFTHPKMSNTVMNLIQIVNF